MSDIDAGKAVCEWDGESWNPSSDTEYSNLKAEVEKLRKVVHRQDARIIELESHINREFEE